MQKSKALFISGIAMLAFFFAAGNLSAKPLSKNTTGNGIPVYDGMNIDQVLGKNPDAIIFSSQKNNKSANSKNVTSQNNASVKGVSLQGKNKTRNNESLFKGVGRDTLTYYQIGQASWYGKRFHGKKTASGQPFDMYQYTAAHRTLPFGTRLLVRNLENGKEVTVVVNDRGPFVQNRILDLSYAAAVALGYEEKGITKIGTIIIDKQPLQNADNSQNQNNEKNTKVRINFSDPDNLPQNKPKQVQTQKSQDPFLLWANQGKPFYKSQNKRAVFLSEENNNPQSDKKFTFEKNQQTNNTPRQGTISVQVGSFKVKDNAIRLKSSLEKKYQQPVYIDHSNGWYRVRMGEFANRNRAKQFQSTLEKNGTGTLLRKN